MPDLWLPLRRRVVRRTEFNILHPRALTAAQHSQAKDNSTYCRFASKCGGNGTCVTAPTFCYHIYKPVCGCDGRTYSNECYAAAAYTSIASIGPCPNDHKEAVEEEQKALLRAGK